jgi:hypothetical protein
MISSHMLTPRWTRAIDVRAEARREDTITLASGGLSLLAVLRDQPRRTPAPGKAQRPVKGPTPLSVPQEIESIPEQEAQPPLSAAGRPADY